MELFEIKREFDGSELLHIKEDKLILDLTFFYSGFFCYLKTKAREAFILALKQYCRALKQAIERFGFDLSLKKGVCLNCHTLVKSACLPLERLLFTKNINTLLYFWDEQSYWDLKPKLSHQLSRQKAIIAPFILSDYFTPRSLVWLYGSMRPKLREEYKEEDAKGQKTNNGAKPLRTDSHTAPGHTREDYLEGQKIVVGCGHNMSEAFYYCAYVPLIGDELARLNYEAFDYYLAIDKNSYQTLRALFSTLALPTIPLKAGSPSLDAKIAQGIEGSLAQYFYFMPKSLESSKICEVIELFLAHNKTIKFRMHMSKLYVDAYEKQDSYAFVKKFLSHPNFILDQSPSISQEALCESIVITDISSVSYSSPWSSLKPTLLYAPNQKELDLVRIKFQSSFANPILHKVATTPQELLKEAIKLEQAITKNGPKIQQTLKNYRQATLYHLGDSQQKIEKILLSFLQ